MKKTILLAVLLGLSASALADMPEPPKDGHPPKPPKEAIEACQGKVEHAVCGFNTPDGHHFQGVCSKHPHEQFLACGPKMDHPPKPPKDGDVPPPKD